MQVQRIPMKRAGSDECRLALQDWLVCLTHHCRKMGRDGEIEEIGPGEEVEPEL